MNSRSPSPSRRAPPPAIHLVPVAQPTPRASPHALDFSLLSPPLSPRRPRPQTDAFTHADPFSQVDPHSPTSPTHPVAFPPSRPASAPPVTSVPRHEEDESSRYTLPSPTSPIVRPGTAFPLVRRRTTTAAARFTVGELPRPPPPLFRPTTFWRNNRRSGVSGHSYSPGSHLVRRSTFIAAGLDLPKPCADLSAFGVEARSLSLVLPPDAHLHISGSHE